MPKKSAKLVNKQVGKKASKQSIHEKIDCLHRCDCTKKLKPALEKASAELSKELDKAKTQVMKLQAKYSHHRQSIKVARDRHRVKPTGATKTKIERLTEVGKQLTSELATAKQRVPQCKEELVALKLSLKKHLAKQKAVLAFEKLWHKQQQRKAKPKKKSVAPHVLKTLKFSRPDVLGLQISGELHHKDYQTRITPKVDALVNAYEKCRIYIEVSHFHGWDFEAAMDDLKLGVRHRHDLERIAIVGDQKWEAWIVRMFSVMMDGEVKFFLTKDKRAAKEWIVS